METVDKAMWDPYLQPKFNPYGAHMDIFSVQLHNFSLLYLLYQYHTQVYYHFDNSDISPVHNVAISISSVVIACVFPYYFPDAVTIFCSPFAALTL